MDSKELEILKNITDNLSALVGTVKALTPEEKKPQYSCRLLGGLRDEQVRRIILESRRTGAGYQEIEKILKRRFPGAPEKHVSTMTCWRFLKNARAGRLAEFGVKFP